MSVKVASVVVASVTASVGASVCVELVFITVLYCDVFLVVTWQLELGAANFALMHCSAGENIRI